ncbi:MAG TPA: hypothetical protein VJJ23_01635, partial [Candidatus Nanoarchaeia archaeon]|nr:hypothetical protein [Candidatus Nanoarchaeia archaeon]
EVYRIFNSKSLNNVQTTDREQTINNEVNRLIKKYSSDDEVNICFTEFEDIRIPNEDEIEYLTNLSYVHSDITPLPMLPKVAKNITSDNFNEYNTFIKKAIDAIGVLNNKPIMGVIPMSVPSTFMPMLLKTYTDNGITALCLDFQGSTVGSSLTKIRALVKSIKRQNLLEKSFIYSINLGAGKLPKTKEVVPAKDILSFGYGFDAIGGQHVRKKLSPEIRAKILSSKNMFENSLRLFNKNDYGYYRATKKETIEGVYPKDSSIPLAILEKIKSNSNVDKLFNQEQQGFEAVNLRTIIKEEHKLLSYLNKKKYVEKNDIKMLENIKNK